MPCPPSTYEGLTNTGYFSSFATSTPSATVHTPFPFGLFISNLSRSSSNFSLSSAASIFTKSVPSIFIFFSCKNLASFIAV